MVLQYATLGTLPKLDALGRPLFAYGRTIHEHCPRRAHFDAGRFANEFGDEGHRQGYCLYKLGCKGPMTHANCSTLAFGEVVDCWPIGIGHPCVGCTEQAVAFRIPMHDAGHDRAAGPARYLPADSRGAGTHQSGRHRGRRRDRRRAARRRVRRVAEDRQGRRPRRQRRRARLQAGGVAWASLDAPHSRPQSPAPPPRSRGRHRRPSFRVAPSDAVGLLYDTTKCIGCKACVVACREANGLAPDTSWSGGLYQAPLDLNEKTKTVIKLYDDGNGHRSFIKAQCMHCVDPACANACMLGAFKKREFGIVTYDVDYCIGCRYCEVACPFGVPKFEWAKASPKMVKCELCNHRIAAGKESGVRRSLPEAGGDLRAA